MVTSAVVRDITTRQVTRSGSRYGDLHLELTVDGRTYEATVDAADHAGDYVVGQRVDVVHDAADPTEASLVGVRPPEHGVPAFLLLLLAFVLAVGATVSALHVRRVRKIVNRYAWVPTLSSLVEVEAVYGLRSRARILLQLHDPSGPAFADRVGIRRFPATVDGTAWVAGYGQRLFVVAPPGGRPALLVRHLASSG
jgi:hypothetical protein